VIKRLLALLAGALGLRALLRRRPRPVSSPAGDLRARLDEARGIEDDRGPFEAGEVPVDEAEPADVAARRADVHARARRAMDDLG
jgi:hypothetical protein